MCPCVCVIFSYICTSIKILSTKYMKKIDFNWYVDLDFSVDSWLFYILILLYLGRLLRADDHGSHLRWAVRIVQLWAWISQEKLWLRSSNAIYIYVWYLWYLYDMIWYCMAYIYIYVCAHTYMCIISMLLSARKSLSYSCVFLLKGAAKKTLHLAGCIEPVVFLFRSHFLASQISFYLLFYLW